MHAEILRHLPELRELWRTINEPTTLGVRRLDLLWLLFTASTAAPWPEGEKVARELIVRVESAEEQLATLDRMAEPWPNVSWPADQSLPAKELDRSPLHGVFYGARNNLPGSEVRKQLGGGTMRHFPSLVIAFTLLFAMAPPANACSADCVCNAARAEACTRECDDLAGETGVCFDANCGMYPRCCYLKPNGNLDCESADICEEQCGAPYEGSSEHWALYEYDLTAEGQITNPEAFYASSSAFVVTQLSEETIHPGMPPGHYRIFTWQIEHAQKRSGRPDLTGFRRLLQNRLEGSLPRRGEIALRLAVDAEGKLVSHRVLYSEPSDLGDLLAPHLQFYPGYAGQPTAKPIVDAVRLSVEEGRIGSIGQLGYVFERLE